MTENEINPNGGPIESTSTNPIIDGFMSVMSALGKEVDEKKAKGYLILIAVGIVALILLKYYIGKKL